MEADLNAEEEEVLRIFRSLEKEAREMLLKMMRAL